MKMTRHGNMTSCMRLAMIVFFLSYFCMVGSASIRIGAMYPMYSSSGEVLAVGPQQQAAIVLAIREINNKTDGIADDLLPNDELLLSVSQLHTSFFSASAAAHHLAKEAFGGTGVHAVLGPDRLNLVEGSFRGLHESDVPQLMYDIGTTIFSEPGLYPQFVRLSATDAIQGRVLAETVFDYFGWTKVSLFYLNEPLKVNSVLNFKRVARALGITILSEHAIAQQTTDMSFHIRRAKRAAAHIFVLFLEPEDAALLLTQGRDQNLFTRGDQILGSDHLTNLSLIDALNARNASNVSSLMKGYLGIHQRVSLESEEGAAFVARWRRQRSTKEDNPSNGAVWCDNSTDDDSHALYAVSVDGSDIATSAILAYDATYTLAHALHSLRQRGFAFSRKNLFDSITSVERVGVSGPIGYSTEFKWLQSDRNIGINFDVVNYRGNDEDDDNGGYHEFVFVGTWNSEAGFRLCDVSSSQRACYPIEFNTASGDAPLDGPHVRIRTMPRAFEATLFAAFIFGIVMVCGFAAILYVYRKKRLVKISQPILQGIILLGCACGFLRVLIAIQPVTQLMCISVTWLSHMSFILIFGTLLAKTWRIHRVMSSGVKKVKITLSDILQLIGLMIAVVVFQLILLTILADSHVELVTVVDTQEKYVKERKCAFNHVEDILNPVLFFCEFLLIVWGAYLSYASRSIPSGVGEVSKISNAIFSLVAVVVIGLLVVYGVKPKPITRRFVILLLFIAVLYRTMYVLFGELTMRLLMGYDLDKNFNLSRNVNSVLDTFRRKGGGSVCSEQQIPSRSASQEVTVAWTDDLLDREIELCRANALRYQKRLMELQEVAMARGAMRSSSSASNPSVNDGPGNASISKASNPTTTDGAVLSQQQSVSGEIRVAKSDAQSISNSDFQVVEPTCNSASLHVTFSAGATVDCQDEHKNDEHVL